MNSGRVRTAMTCAALVLAGCFNPPAKDETGETGAAGTTSEAGSTSAPTTTSAATTDDGDTTTTTTTTSPPTSDGCPPGGCTTEAGETGETGETGATTGAADLVFTPLPVAIAGASVPATMNIDADATHDDLVVTSATAAKFFYYAGGSLTTAELPSKPALALAVEDLQPDTRDDVWLAQFGMPARVALYVNTGVFTEYTVDMPEYCNTPLWMATGRINSDERTDVAIACKEYPNGIFAAYRDVDGLDMTVTGMDLGMEVDATAVALVDVRGSAADDLLLVSSDPGAFHVYLGGANGTFISPQSLNLPGATGVAIGHLNKDDRVDVGIVRAGSSVCDVFLGGPEQLGGVRELMCGPSPIDIAFADVDGDGEDDVVTLHPGELHIALNRGGGTSFTELIVVPASASAQRLALGNYVGGPAMDIAVTSIDTLTIYEQAG